jgi:cytochrome c-type biogenesis protein CcmF
LLMQIVTRMKKPGRIAPSFWGMHLAHLGIAVIVVGITFVKGYEVERDVRMGIQDTVSIGEYSFELMGVSDVDGPNYKALRGEVKVTQGGEFLEMLYPEKRKYFSSAMPMTEAAIDSGLFRDLYVSLGEPVQGDKPQWSVRVFYKPFVSWLWYGAILMVLGGLLAVSDRRYRKSAASLD